MKKKVIVWSIKSLNCIFCLTSILDLKIDISFSEKTKKSANLHVWKKSLKIIIIIIKSKYPTYMQGSVFVCLVSYLYLGNSRIEGTRSTMNSHGRSLRATFTLHTQVVFIYIFFYLKDEAKQC